MLKIKLARTGKRSQPQYRIVVAEARSKRDGQCTAILGYFNPLTNPPRISLDPEKYQAWVHKGAVPTPTVKALFSKRHKE